MRHTPPTKMTMREPASAAASGSAAGLATSRLHGADERAHELAVDLSRHGVDVDALAGQEIVRVLHLVDAGGLDAGLLEAGGLQLRVVLVLLQRSGDAADPQQHVAPQLLGHWSPRHDVRNGETATGLQHPERFAQYLILVP